MLDWISVIYAPPPQKLCWLLPNWTASACLFTVLLADWLRVCACVWSSRGFRRYLAFRDTGYCPKLLSKLLSLINLYIYISYLVVNTRSVYYKHQLFGIPVCCGDSTERVWNINGGTIIRRVLIAEGTAVPYRLANWFIFHYYNEVTIWTELASDLNGW